MRKASASLIALWVIVQIILWTGIQKISIDLQFFPTLMNGITSATSILVGFTGILLTLGLSNKIIDLQNNKNYLYLIIGIIGFSLGNVCSAYGSILDDASSTPLKWSLSGLFTGYVVFMDVMAFMQAQMHHKNKSVARIFD